METQHLEDQASCFQRVRQVVAANQRLPLEQVTLDTRLADLSMDSHDRITLLFEIESEFDIVVPNEVGEIQTVRELAEGVARLLAEQKPPRPKESQE